MIGYRENIREFINKLWELMKEFSKIIVCNNNI